MSLNKFMHPRNRYKYKRPDFEDMARKYPEFKQHVTDNDKGKPVLDFKDADALRVLTTCLLQEDYGLKIEVPPDRLVPTLPLRLNYVHWIEDITKDWNKQKLSAIDVGTGACCVYPILAVSGNQWQFLATESDEVNYSYAVKNMAANNLTDRIKVVKVSEEVILEGVIGNLNETYDFCMCNPPFFADHFEAQGLVSRTMNRPDAKTMSTASPQECIVQGGEIAFVRKMIEESNFLQEKVRVYTTMLGKKASLAPLKEILRRYKISNFATTEFCQGKTMRWGLAWTFDKTVNFPKSEFSQSKKVEKKSVVHIIPTNMGEIREPVYDLVIFFKQLFSELKVHCREGKQSKYFALLTLTAAENTWIHSRRKRRQMMREVAAAEISEMKTGSAESSLSTGLTLRVSETPGKSASTSSAVSSLKDVPDTVSLRSCKDEKDLNCESADRHKDEISAEQAITGMQATDSRDSKGRNLKRKAESETSVSADERPAKSVKQDVQCRQEDLICTTAAGGETDLTSSLEEAQTSSIKEHFSKGEYSASKEEDGEAEEQQLVVEEEVSVKGKDRPPATFVLKCHMSVRVQGSDLAVELSWLGGDDIQLMHQLMQVLKNRLAARKVT